MNAEGKEKWVSDVMDSLDGLQRPAYNHELYANVMKSVAKRSSQAGSAIVRRLAVAASLLLVVNVASVVKYSQHATATSQSSTDINQSISSQLSDFNGSGF